MFEPCNGQTLDLNFCSWIAMGLAPAFLEQCASNISFMIERGCPSVGGGKMESAGYSRKSC